MNQHTIDHDENGVDRDRRTEQLREAFRVTKELEERRDGSLARLLAKSVFGASDATVEDIGVQR